jgi:hypothetical protein
MQPKKKPFHPPNEDGKAETFRDTTSICRALLRRHPCNPGGHVINSLVVNQANLPIRVSL